MDENVGEPRRPRPPAAEERRHSLELVTMTAIKTMAVPDKREGARVMQAPLKVKTRRCKSLRSALSGRCNIQ